MIFSDSYLLLEDAKQLLNEIEILYNDALKQEEIPSILRVRVKQFLDNVNSSLEYAAFDIFSFYCAHHVKEVKNEKQFNWHESKIYFPVIDTKSEFDPYIDKWFFKLRDSEPGIIDVFKKYQPFPTRSKWLQNLKTLVNTNKHRNLSKPSHQQSTYIKNLTIQNGVLTNFEGSMETNIIFSEMDLPVLKTLKRIYASAPKLIDELEEIVQRG